MLTRTGVGEFGSGSLCALINDGKTVQSTIANQKNSTGLLRNENIPDLPAYLLSKIVGKKTIVVSTLWKSTA
jgi:hypothetical protein